MILIADDNSFNINSLCMILHRTYKINVEECCLKAFDGRQALELFKSNAKRIKLVFMDCQMPIMDGFESSKLIRQHVSASQEL